MEREKKNPAADFERQRKQKVMLFSAVLSCLFLVVIWLIFRPAPKRMTDGTNGINITVPDGKEQTIEGSKQKAVERVRSEDTQNRQLSTLGDNTFSLLDDGLKPAEMPPTDDPVQRAEAANRAMQAQVQDFYRTPQRNAEVEALKEQVAALQTQLDAERRQPDALELAEQQYRLAQKYLGGSDTVEPEPKKDKTRKSVMRPVRASELRASTLDPSFDLSMERNLGFLTAAGSKIVQSVPTVQACVAETQVVRVGSMVRLRLLEPVRIEGIVVPRNTPLYGQATIDNARLHIVVSSIECEGHIFAVEAIAYDLDGQPGLNVPNSKERTAMKEALASIGQTAGTSINVTRSAGQQIVSDLSRGALQASSRYVAEKLREIKVTLKADHRLLLISKEQ